MPLPLPLIKYVRFRAAWPCFNGLTLAACCIPPAPITRGEAKVALMLTTALVLSGVNRMATLVMRDNLASLLTEKYRRVVTSCAQNLLASTYLQFLSVSSPSP